MRLFRRLSRLSPLLVPLSSAVLLACFSSSNPPPPAGETPQPDGGTPVADATVPDAPATVPDGGMEPVPEAAPDAIAETGAADDPATPPAPVSVLVTSANGPEAGRMVVFSDASGQVISTQTTDATGVVLQEVFPSQAPVEVTVLLGSPTTPSLFTVTGVQTSDTLTAFDAPPADTLGLDVTVPPVVDAGTITTYDFIAGNCGGTSNSPEGLLSLSLECLNPAGAFPMLVLAEGDVPVAYLSQKNNALGTDGGTTSLNLSGDWQYAMGTATVNVNNVPSTEYPTLAYSEVASGVPYPSTDPEPLSTEQGYYSSFPTHPAYPDFVQTEAEVAGMSLASNNAYVSLAVADRAAPSLSPTVTFDNSEFPPTVSDASVDTSDPSRPAVSWTTSSAISTGVATFVALHWTSSDDAGGSIYGTWTVVTSGSAASVQVPVLPAAASTYAPGAGAVWPVDNPTVAILAGPAAGTYDALRKTAAVVGANLHPDNSPLIPPLPVDGRAQVSLYYRLLP
jgi:hypothetical protein